jgi:hypothetical protein
MTVYQQPDRALILLREAVTVRRHPHWPAGNCRRMAGQGAEYFAPNVAVAARDACQSDSGNDIHARDLGLCGLEFLRSLDALLVGFDRRGTCVGRFVCDEPDFCLTNHDMGRVGWAYVAHVPLLEFLQICRDSFTCS